MPFSSLIFVLISVFAAWGQGDGIEPLNKRNAGAHAVSVLFTELTVSITSEVLTTVTETQLFTELRNLRASTITQLCVGAAPETQTFTARPVTIVLTATPSATTHTVETVVVSTSSTTLECIPTQLPDELSRRDNAAENKDAGNAGVTWTSGNVVFVTSTIVATVTICPTSTERETTTATISSIAQEPDVTVCKNVQVRTTLTPTTRKTRTIRAPQKTVWSITRVVVTDTVVVPDVQPCTAPVIAADIKPAFSTQIIWG